METNAFDVLKERGFFRQCTDAPAVYALLASRSVPFYVGFDPTADSLHCGSLTPIMAMAHMQRAGHFPVAIVGGGTALVGDPSGKTEMRKMLSRAEIDTNSAGILAQLQRFLDLDGTKGRFLNNADWLAPLHYIDFLRDVGRYFRVNEMVKAESYRLRLEREEGLSFIEFNYQLLQAYDFLVLFREHGCLLQMGGDDQWGNIVAGTDLIRRVEGGQAHGLTFPLLTTARGEKMGKTAGGAIWLGAERTSPYDYFQYWINTDDKDVERFLALFTFLPMDEVRRLGALQGADLRQAKEILAFETTRLCHGEEEALKAREAAKAAFGGGGDLGNVPTLAVDRSRVEAGIPLYELLHECGLTPSRKEARRLIAQGGASVNGETVAGEEVDLVLNAGHFPEGALMLRAGKKRFHRVLAE